MINLTPTYPNTVFLPFSLSLLEAQINGINSTGILSKDFPKKLRRTNTGTAPDGSGAVTQQIDILLSPNSFYGFQNLQSAQAYGQQGANQMVNNACYYVENITRGYYQMVVWEAV